MKHTARLTARIAGIVAGLFAVMSLSGTAFAHTDPIEPVSGHVPANAPNLLPSVSDASSSAWGPALIVGLVVAAMLVIGLVIVGQQVASLRRATRSPALTA